VEFGDVLARRRMQRSFLPDPVADESIERIVRTIRRAPSGGYSQGQSLVVVTDVDMRRRIADAFDEQQYVETGLPPFISTAPLHLVISANERLYHDRYNEPDKLQATGGVEITWPVPYWFVDAGALMMLVQLATIDEGLASAFIGHPDQKRIFDELLGLPADVVPIGLALIGHPAEDLASGRVASRMKERRRPLDEVVHRERWGGGG
jgi:nitroreductase